ncbi:Kelch repeat-containing protein [Chitinimonas sp. PSY-7]|uniref:kelch repeat-containing protein n=1 Tax=Chitinimonas sp. PSY-7 TaxID=3459088 RepID=UPI00403FE4FD
MHQSILAVTLYIFGGMTPGDYLEKSVDVFDFATGKIHKTADMPSKRYGVRPVTVGSKIYVIGGHNGDASLDEVLILDTKKDKWSVGPSTNVTRDAPGTILVNDKIYAVGGGIEWDKPLDTVEFLDLKKNKWFMSEHKLHAKRFAPGLVQLGDYLYVVGGYDGINALSSVEKMSLKTGEWSNATAMSLARWNMAVAVVDGKIYAIGGNDLKSSEVYDPATDKWSILPDMSQIRKGATAQTYKGHIYVFGGSGNDGKALDSIETFDLKKNQWTILAEKLTVGREHAGSAFLPTP